MRRVAAALLVALGVAASVVGVRAQPPPPPAQPAPDPVRLLLDRIEQAVAAGDAAGFTALLAPSADRARIDDFTSSEFQPDATRVVIQERDRQPLKGTPPGDGHRLIVELFAEFGARARIATWRLDVKRSAADAKWRVADAERLTSVGSLYRLSLNPAKQYDAHDLTITAEDLELTLARGSVFVADTDQGVTGLVLLGSGRMRFTPRPETEKGQVKIFCGSETLDARFDAAFIRINPGDFESRVPGSALVARATVDPRDFKRADVVFREDVTKSFGLELGDLTRDAWSLAPSSGDFLAEVHTRRFDTLTYARSASEPEDITLFDRRQHHNIALYASEEKLAQRGPFYNEDDLSDYDILDYDIDVAVTPDRQWIDGRARLKLKIRAKALGTITLRLANALTVRSIATDQFGPVFGIRVRNQNTVVINLPTALAQGSELRLTMAYSGRLEPQPADRETVGVQAGRRQSSEDMPTVLPEPSFLYSSRSYWYPQGQTTGYATARIRITVPASLDCVASGDRQGPPTPVAGTDPSQPRKAYVFVATQPVRYLAFIISRFVRVETTLVTFADADPPGGSRLPAPTGVSYDALSLSVEANPRQVQHGRELAERAADIAKFYTSLVGDCPYPSFTLALIENDLPGGHSPAYFAALNQPLPITSFTWRNDPAAFENYPEFFIAHELAHQWWGQAIGWRNYHEQWLSEGFAQYFAALYAQRHRGDDVFDGVLRQMRKWAMDESDQGPVYLGYRLGHIKNDSRIFRAVVYDKGAAVLHMLRLLVGDDAFFRGVRRFYQESRFQKAGTEEFRIAMEAESGRPLRRFFDEWIYGTRLPRLKFSYRVEDVARGQDVVLHVEQVGEIFDVPLTVTLQYTDRRPVDVVVPVTDRAIDMRVALTGTLRGVSVNRDSGTLANVEKS